MYGYPQKGKDAPSRGTDTLWWKPPAVEFHSPVWAKMICFLSWNCCCLREACFAVSIRSFEPIYYWRNTCSVNNGCSFHHSVYYLQVQEIRRKWNQSWNHFPPEFQMKLFQWSSQSDYEKWNLMFVFCFLFCSALFSTGKISINVLQPLIKGLANALSYCKFNLYLICVFVCLYKTGILCLEHHESWELTHRISHCLKFPNLILWEIHFFYLFLHFSILKKKKNGLI